jgi:hypothetical protein
VSSPTDRSGAAASDRRADADSLTRALRAAGIDADVEVDGPVAVIVPATLVGQDWAARRQEIVALARAAGFARAALEVSGPHGRRAPP